VHLGSRKGAEVVGETGDSAIRCLCHVHASCQLRVYLCCMNFGVTHTHAPPSDVFAMYMCFHYANHPHMGVMYIYVSLCYT